MRRFVARGVLLATGASLFFISVSRTLCSGLEDVKKREAQNSDGKTVMRAAA